MYVFKHKIQRSRIRPSRDLCVVLSVYVMFGEVGVDLEFCVAGTHESTLNPEILRIPEFCSILPAKLFKDTSYAVQLSGLCFICAMTII